MSEIVYTHTDQNRSFIKDMDYGRRPADVKVTIFQSPDKVAAVMSYLVVGVPRGHKDKRYYHWRSVESFGLRRNRAGNIMAWDCKRPFDAKVGVQWTHRQPREPFMMLADEREDWDYGMAFKRAVWYTFGIKSANDILPMMDNYGLIHYWTVPSSLRPAFRTPDWTEYVARAFGKTRTTPRLVAAVKQTDPYIIAYAQQFRGLVDDEKMVKFIEDNHFDEEMEEGFTPHSPNIRPGLLIASQELRDGLISSQMDLSDTRRVARIVMLGKANVERCFAPRVSVFNNGPARTLSDIYR